MSQTCTNVLRAVQSMLGVESVHTLFSLSLFPIVKPYIIVKIIFPLINLHWPKEPIRVPKEALLNFEMVLHLHLRPYVLICVDWT